MTMQLTWKTAVLALIGLVAIATVALNSRAEGSGIATRGAAAGVLDCSVHDPFSPCFDIDHGYPAHDLFVTEDL
jgi:hypothetical protein